MKAVFTCFLSLMIASVCLAKAQVVNSGFEAMTMNTETEKLEPDNWTSYIPSQVTVYFAAKTDYVYSGTYSYKIAARNGYGMIYQEVSSGFNPGETYSLWLYGKGDTNGGWIMDEPGDQVDVYIKFKDASGAQIGQEESLILFDTDPETQAPLLDSTEWLKSPVIQFTVPDGTASFLVKIRSVDGTPDGNNNDGTSIYLDDITMDVLPLATKNPTPADNSIEQPASDLVFSWEPGDDPYFAGTPNSDITGYYLYVDVYNVSSDPGEPNGFDEPNNPIITPIAVDSTEYPADGIDYGYDKKVYWRVDESINGSSPYSTSTVAGTWWSFYTESSFPEVSTQPQDVDIVAGESGQMTIAVFTSDYPVVMYEWYNYNDELVLSGSDADTLTFENAATGISGNYYCVLTNSQGKQTTSEAAFLRVKGILLDYSLDNDLSDSASGFDGTATNLDPNFPVTITYDPSGVSGSAAVFDGESYSNLGKEAFPNSRQGLDAGTIVCWFKKDTTETGTVMSCYNNDLTTCFNLSLQTSEKLYFFIRAETHAFTTVEATVPGIYDGQWHQVVATYENGSDTVLYLDGEEIASAGGLGENDVFAPWTYSMVIGAGNTRGTIADPYVGMLDNIVMYNYPLTNKQVLDTYNDYAAVTKSLCIEAYASTFDLAGPGGVGPEYADCRVDMLDFAAVAQAWLDCGLYPECFE